MIASIELAEFAERNGWLVVEKEDHWISYLTPSGNRVLVVFNEEDGSIIRLDP